MNLLLNPRIYSERFKNNFDHFLFFTQSLKHPIMQLTGILNGLFQLALKNIKKQYVGYFL